MATELQKQEWNSWKKSYNDKIIFGLENKKVFPYSDKLIEKLRTIYYGGLPASIILLNKGLTNGFCYDRALLMSRAFIDDDTIDINLLYASVNSLRLNPEYIDDNEPMSFDHCIVEIKDEEHDFIIDTTIGFIFDKDYYFKLENPVIRKINTKQSIIDFLNEDEIFEPEDLERDKYASILTIPNIESTYGRPGEMYSKEGLEYLQKEIALFKEKIKYDELVREVEEEMEDIGFEVFKLW